MPEPFPIYQLKFDSPIITEQLGSKPKFWFLLEGDDQPWLFKFTRENTGEDWSEKIASEIATLLELPAARVEFAIFNEKRGCASRSFVKRDQGFDLVHGSEVLTGRILGYDKLKRWHQSNHTIKNIIATVEKTFPERLRIPQLRTLAGFIVLDAIICNTDRHHDNWALLRGPSEQGKKAVHQIAPSFDHASSLGRELLDARRKLMLERERVGEYVLKGHGGIYWKDTDEKGENPVALAIKAAKEYPHYFQPWLAKAAEIKTDDFNSIVERIPVEWMGLEAKQFCLKLLSVTTEKLKTIQL